MSSEQLTRSNFSVAAKSKPTGRESANISNMGEEVIVRKENIADYYDIGDQIGSGQFAVVKKLQEKSTGLKFAAKFMKKKRSRALKKGITEEQFLREADVLRCVDHKGVICLHEVFETQVEFVLILELLTGGELFEFLSEQEFLTEDEAVGFLKQVIEAIEYLHLKRIVHLDIKPENIVLKESGSNQIKLIDFGLARMLSEGEMVREIMGTPEFVAPEIIAFEAVGTETDMWAIGVLTYIMLSGASPFLGDDVNETFSNISMVDYEFDEEYFKDISMAAKDFISSLLVKAPSDRLNAKECLEHEWMQELENSEDEDVCDNLIANQSPSRKGELKKRRSTMIKTDAFKAFTARARWQKSLNKVIAISRLALLGKKNHLKRNSSDVENDYIKPSLKTQNSTDSQGNDEGNTEEKTTKDDVETIIDQNHGTQENSNQPEKEQLRQELDEGRNSDFRERDNKDEKIESGNKNEISERRSDETTVLKNDNGTVSQENQVEVRDLTVKEKGANKVDSVKSDIRIPPRKRSDDAKQESLIKNRLNKFEKLKATFFRSNEVDQNTQKTRRKFSGEHSKRSDNDFPEKIPTRRKSDQLSLRVNWERRIAEANEQGHRKGHSGVGTSKKLNITPSSERLRRKSQPLDAHSTKGTHTTKEHEESPRRVSAPLANGGERGRRLEDTAWIRRPGKAMEDQGRTSTPTKTEELKWELTGSGKTQLNRFTASLENPSNENTGEQGLRISSSATNKTTIEASASLATLDPISRDEIVVISTEKSPCVQTGSNVECEHNDDSLAVIDKEHTLVVKTLQSHDSSKTTEDIEVTTRRATSSPQTGRKVGVVENPRLENPARVENEKHCVNDVPRKNQEPKMVQTVVKHERNPDETDFPQYALTLQKVTSKGDGDHKKDDFVWVVRTEKNKRREFLTKVLSSKMNAAKNGSSESAPVDIFEKKRIRHKPLSEKGPPVLKHRTKSAPVDTVTTTSELKVKHHSVAVEPTREGKHVTHIQLTQDMPAVKFKIQTLGIQVADP